MSAKKRLLVIIGIGVALITTAVMVTYRPTPRDRKDRLVETSSGVVYVIAGGETYRFNRFVLDMVPEATREDVEEIVVHVNGRVVGTQDAPLFNEYRIEVYAETLEEFYEMKQTLKDLHDSRVERVDFVVLLPYGL